MKQIYTSLLLVMGMATYGQQPGDLINSEKKMDDSASQVLQRMASFGDIQLPTEIADLFQCLAKDLEAYKLTYYTTDYHGNLTKAYGLVMYPKVNYPLSTVLLEHPTTDKRENVPSNLLSTRKGGFIIDMLYALNGYYVVSPDYLGLGDSPGVHPYGNAKTEASASIDMLIAADKFLNQKGLKRYNEYFVSGYSQGGHSTLAVLKENTEKYKKFNFKQAYAGAGPYDLSKTTFEDGVLNKEEYPSTAFIAYIVNSAQSLGFKQYNSSYTEIIAPDFQELYQKHVIEEEGGLDWGPLKWRTLFKKEYLDQVITSNSTLRAYLKESDVYNFYNTTPTVMSYTTADQDIPYQNALKTESVQRNYYSFFDLSKYNIYASNLGPFSHTVGVFPYIIASIAKFNSTRLGGYFNWNAMLFGKTTQTPYTFNQSRLSSKFQAPDNQEFEIVSIYNVNSNKKVSHKQTFENLPIGAYVLDIKKDDKTFKIPFVKENSIAIPKNELILNENDGKWLINTKGFENEDITMHLFDNNKQLIHSKTYEKNTPISINYTNLDTNVYTLELATKNISLHTEINRNAMETNNNLVVSSYENKISVQSNLKIKEICISDITGKLIIQQNLDNLNEANFTIPQNHQVLIIKATYSNGDFETKKIIW